MKICFIAFSLPIHCLGGMQNHAMDLAVGLSQLGNEIYIITSKHPKGIKKKIISENLEIYFVGDIPKTRTKKFFEESYIKFQELNKKYHFDVIYSETDSGLEIIENEHNNIPTVTLLHGYWGIGHETRFKRGDLRGIISGLLKLMEYITTPFSKRIESKSDHLIVINKKTKNLYLKKFHYPPDRISVVYNGINVNFLNKLSSKIDFPDIENYSEESAFIYTGRLSKEKGIQKFLEIIPILKDRIQNFNFIIIGSGKYMHQLRKKCTKLKIEKYVHFIGQIDYSLIPSFLQKAKYYIFPSVGIEGLPLNLIEAMAVGRIVISSNSPEIKEIISDNKTGILINPKNKKQTVNRIMEIYNNPKLQKLIQESAINEVVKRFKIEDMIKNTFTILEKVVNTKKRF